MEDKDSKNIQKDKQKDNGTSKLERILSFHSLDGLVYEKRQRKQAVNNFINIQHKHKHQPSQKIKTYKIDITTKNKNKKEVKLQKYKLKQKSLMKRKKIQSKLKIKKNVSIGKVNKSIGNSSQKRRGRPPNIKTQEQNDKFQEQKAKVDKNGQNQQENSEQNSVSSSQHEEDQYNLEKKKVRAVPIKLKNSQKIAESINRKILPQEKQGEDKKQKQQHIKQIQEKIDQKLNEQKVGKVQQQEIKNKPVTNITKIKKKLGRPRKIIIEPVIEQKQPQIQPIKQNQENLDIEKNKRQILNQNNSKSKSNSIKSSSQRSEQKNQSNKSQQQNSQQNGHQTNKRMLRMRKKLITHQQNNEQQQEQQIGLNGRKRKLRDRRTKGQALKKFTMFQGGSQGQDIQYYETKKKKSNIIQKQYQINRIFRKTQKVNLPNVKLNINISQFSLQNFVEKFKHFDMIHCSIPLDILIKLSNIQYLISKGFIFIWVQKGQIQIGYHWLNRLGFDVIDQIMWVKTNQNMNQVIYDQNIQGEIFPNCRSTCLVGYKCSSSQKTQYCTKISNNIIFSPEKQSPLEKPDQIYEIGDLMMPGARKLEIGFKQAEGWFTLKHVQGSFVRCHKCLRRDRRKLFYIPGDQSVRCQYCLISQAKRKKQQQNEQEKQKQQQNEETVQKQKLLSNIVKQIHACQLQIINESLSQTLKMKCSSCNSIAKQLLELPEQTIQSKEEESFSVKLVCKKCFTLPQNTQFLKVHNLTQIFYPKKTITCSQCLKTCLQKYYFECFTCKNNHILCSNCMLQIPKQDLNTEIQHKKNHRNHDWKLKILNEFPETRAACFTCGDQCMIPYWGCQTCQNWYWCGKCDKSIVPKAHQNHCHYFRDHHLHLII